ncbi:nitric oxide-associated protein 1-like [Centruroides sculpturatus]|uniref:nitric oxide-associated protein 1-like n=1 Tax=Centruroides sculpturatus TaxID=218467 RepID=UPI000C6E073A|nr:nitric oxide-associated protein 1-like [Centruroides sculpturatus]
MVFFKFKYIKNYNPLLKSYLKVVNSKNFSHKTYSEIFPIYSKKLYFSYYNVFFNCQCKRYLETNTKDEQMGDKSTDEQDNVIRRKNVDPQNMPISLLGTGFIDKKIRSTIRSMRKNTEKLDDNSDDDDDDDLPIALKLKLKKENLNQNLTRLNSEISNLNDNIKSSIIQYPYQKVILEEVKLENLKKTGNDVQNNAFDYLEKAVDKDDKLKKEISSLREDFWNSNYGTPNPSLPVSDIPCGGCGALLHCKDSALPGYMPSERFKLFLSKLWKLRGEICQRCIYLKHFNVALNVSVDPSQYPEILSNIKDKNSLVILMIDLMDFPCSIWSNITDIIGIKPIIVVGNKVDLLPIQNGKDLNYVIYTIQQTLKDTGVDRGKNIKHIHLISAKTGYGIEELINKLHKLWKNRGDVYLVGCTNVGKSTLFNSLLHSDYCKVRAVDLVQRATISPWPGTTLNLLKFPIMKINRERLYLRTKRLIEQKKEKTIEKKMRKHLLKETKNPLYATLIGKFNLFSGTTLNLLKFPIMKINRERLYLRTKRLIEQKKEKTIEKKMRKHLLKETKNPLYATLIGNVGMTFKSDDIVKFNDTKIVFDDRSKEFAQSHFCFDTPGAVYHDQILDLLTIEELMLTIPKKIIVPRSYWVRVSQTLFLAGLGRVDLIEAEDLGGICLTVFASDDLPIHMVYLEQAEKFYNKNVGTELLRVPKGGSDRLKDFPELVPKEFTVTGQGWKESSTDILLSSAGWISVTLKEGRTCKLKAYTPGSRGCYLRKPSLLPFAVNMKGKKIKATPAYEIKFI